MNDRIKAQIEKAKQFAKKHPTLVACTVTGLASWAVSRDITTRAVLKDTAGLMYVAGYDVGTLEQQRNILLDFINEKGLGDELRGFVVRKGYEVAQEAAEAA